MDNIAYLLEDKFEDLKSHQDTKFDELKQELKDINYQIQNLEIEKYDAADNIINNIKKGKKLSDVTMFV